MFTSVLVVLGFGVMLPVIFDQLQDGDVVVLADLLREAEAAVEPKESLEFVGLEVEFLSDGGEDEHFWSRLGCFSYDVCITSLGHHRQQMDILGCSFWID